MAWYTDKHKQAHTETYSGRTAATVDARKAAEHGWRVDAEVVSDAPFGDRNWATGGPVGTFLSGMREPNEREIVVTYVRTDEWLAADRSQCRSVRRRRLARVGVRSEAARFEPDAKHEASAAQRLGELAMTEHDGKMIAAHEYELSP